MYQHFFICIYLLIFKTSYSQQTTPIVLLDNQSAPHVQNPSLNINLDKIPHDSMYDVTAYPEDTILLKIQKGAVTVVSATSQSPLAPNIFFHTTASSPNTMTAHLPFVKEKSSYIFNCNNINSSNAAHSFVRIIVMPHPTITTQESDNPKNPIMQKNRIPLDKVRGVYRLKLKPNNYFFMSYPKNVGTIIITGNEVQYNHQIDQDPKTPQLIITDAHNRAENPFPGERIFKVTIPPTSPSASKYVIKLLKIEPVYWDKFWNPDYKTTQLGKVEIEVVF